MPGRNGTGPMGMGPMTGRGAGFCQGSETPAYAGFGQGRGYCGGMGQRRGNRFRAPYQSAWMMKGDTPDFYGKAEPENEKQSLSRQAEKLQAELDMVKKRLSEME